MAIIAAAGGFYVPPIRGHSSVNSGPPPASVLNTSTKRWAYIIRAPKTGTIDGFEFRPHSSSVIAAGSVLRLSLQNVNTAVNPAEPDGSLDQFVDVTGSTVTADQWATTPALTTDGTPSGGKRAVVRNELLALVIQYQSFTGGDAFALAYCAQWQAAPQGDARPFGHFPAEIAFDGTSWIRVVYRPAPFLALRYSDGSFGFISPENPPIQGATVLLSAINVGSSPDEAGARFKFPFPVRVGGAWLLSDPSVGGEGEYELVLYDSNGTSVLERVKVDTNQLQFDSVYAMTYLKFAAEHNLLKDTFYRLVLRPLTVVDTKMFSFHVKQIEHMDALPGGRDWHGTYRTDSGPWVDSTLEHPMMGLHVMGVDEFENLGGGSGIASVGRNFRRGMV